MTRQRVSFWARQVVANRVAIVALVAGGAALLARYGVLPDSAPAHVEEAVTWSIMAVGTVVGILWGQAGVTPADPHLGPRSNRGRRLVEDGRGDEHLPGRTPGVALDDVYQRYPYISPQEGVHPPERE